MTCDYCGRQPAVWMITAADGQREMTRFVCQQHVDAAREICAQIGTPNIVEINYHEREIPPR